MEWAKFQERERKKEEEEKEKERVAYAQIDWHDFVVVETVDFQPNEQGLSVTPDREPGTQSCPGTAHTESIRILVRALSVSVSSLLPKDVSCTALYHLNVIQQMLIVSDSGWASGDRREIRQLYPWAHCEESR